jgi:predicted  nucleic acid-binding Zn-ribbon protein
MCANQVICNNCERVFEEDALPLIEVEDEIFEGCPDCKTDEHLMVRIN